MILKPNVKAKFNKQYQLTFCPLKIITKPVLCILCLCGNRPGEIFYHSPICIVECVSEYIFLILIMLVKKQESKKKAKESKEEKTISVEMLCVL